MADWNIVQADVMTWARDYDGPPFHALLTDCPFHLTSDKGGLVECSQCGAKMARRYRYCHQCGGEMNTKAARTIDLETLHQRYDGKNGIVLPGCPGDWLFCSHHQTF